MRFSAALSVAILASAAFAAPVDTEQHPLASSSHVSKVPADAAGAAAPQQLHQKLAAAAAHRLRPTSSLPLGNRSLATRKERRIRT
ncbi:uncharacterized protein CLUP02_13335 [Colletotrichum lupini]|uniref:Uncharacterized protein n=1 Tax=Colletotrichum lupini TaxID=145971 RepID=A0A9Q8T241_9PEZI|nr:uncharacterized protein CLUP02_13335 [Colletotrichum lupini]UQC87814.1 hypothetical protein CLUP02_13335 [Colletotrichum lupini]